jgi:probable F420-dependent oxidoreductase
MVAVHLSQDPQFVPLLPGLAGELERAGYDGIWLGEVNALEVVSGAALAASGTATADIGLLLNTFTRAPTVLAMSAWTLGHLAPGRAHIVLGVASPLLVQRWNGIAYHRLADRLADTLRFLRAALAGDRVGGEFETFDSSGFALPAPPEHPPGLLIAACGPRALELAATEADGVVLNWMSADDIDRVEPLPADRSRVSLVVPVCPTSDREQMEAVMRPVFADYLMAPAYADQQRRLGRGATLEPMWDAWTRGDRPGARAAVPDSVLDELVVWGAPADCRRRVTQIEAAAGIRAIATYFPPPGTDLRDAALA